MKQQYHFVLMKNKDIPGTEYRWYLKADSEAMIREHYKEYVCHEIEDGTRQLIKRAMNKEEGHFIGHFAPVAYHTALIKELPILEAPVEVENAMLKSRLSYFLKHGVIYLPPSLSVLLWSPESYEIIDELCKDNLVYPHEEMPSLQDFSLIQWPGGQHWYAKLGKIDILDQFGNQRWNTLEDAQETCKWYIQKYYHKT